MKFQMKLNPNGAVELYRRVQILLDKGFTEFISL